MINIEHYSYRVRWSVEDEAFVATVAEFPSLSWIAEDQVSAFSGIKDLLGGIINDMRKSGENIPEPYGERSYSGKFQVRIPPEAHRKLTIEAAEQKVSLNRLISNRLVGG